MTTLTHLPPAASPRARQPRRTRVHPLESPALASLLTPLLISGVLTALAVPAVQLSLLGPVNNFASLWMENWLLAWAICFPVVYLAGPAILRLARFLSVPARAPLARPPMVDLAVFARGSNRHGFSVSRNLKVREDFYRA